MAHCDFHVGMLFTQWYPSLLPIGDDVLNNWQHSIPNIFHKAMIEQRKNVGNSWTRSIIMGAPRTDFRFQLLNIISLFISNEPWLGRKSLSYCREARKKITRRKLNLFVVQRCIVGEIAPDATINCLRWKPLKRFTITDIMI